MFKMDNAKIIGLIDEGLVMLRENIRLREENLILRKEILKLLEERKVWMQDIDSLSSLIKS